MPTLTAEIAPLEVRNWLPVGYLKQVQQSLKRRNGARQYSDSTISEVVRDGRTTHAIWPIVVRLARKEKKRRETEAAANAAYLGQQVP